MAVKPLKNPRYKPMKTQGGRRYLDTHTGAILTRSQFEAATRDVVTNTGATGDQVIAAKALGSQGETWHMVAHTATGDFPVPQVESPDGPAAPSAADLVAFGDRAEAIAHAAAKNVDTLATKLADGVALCTSFISGALLPEQYSYWALPDEALQKVFRPGARLIARRLPVEAKPMSPDGEDLVELFNGILFCVTAVSANKMLWNVKQDQMLREMAQAYDSEHGPGSFAATFGDRSRGNTRLFRRAEQGSPAPVQGRSEELRASSGTESSGTTSGDTRRDSALIAELFAKDARRRRERRPNGR